MIRALLIASQFNSTFYTASVTVIPIFFVTLAVELGAARSPVMQRMVALDHLTGIRTRWSSRLRRMTMTYYDLHDVSSHDKPSATSSEEQSVGDEEHGPSPHR
jgi:hypothetical protein